MADFDPATPSIARVYDYLLNGKDNFAVDREVAEKLLAVVPISADVMRENRQFLARATRWAAGQGISYVVLSVGRGDGDAANQGFRAYSSGGNQSYNHSVPDFTSFFGDLTLVPPGMVDAREWRPGPGEEGPFPPRSGYTVVGVARVG